MLWAGIRGGGWGGGGRGARSSSCGTSPSLQGSGAWVVAIKLLAEEGPLLPPASPQCSVLSRQDLADLPEASFPFF